MALSPSIHINAATFHACAVLQQDVRFLGARCQCVRFTGFFNNRQGKWLSRSALPPICSPRSG